ncbi:tRNA pseudouridine(65) synthase TruC [Desulfuromonas carbonis]|uniref:tRNA pseudouridine(65) synthase TruC n=1 Tax=Desulfuromonas sp. DDH964 TaxID=1823759 RepID=UPI00078C828A|nr:tRNA pseudouridine(65) synthase TruC [Desulfuromonas sp. DDH964]AMV73291.1 tRNA pseudouridine 65 synthase [Desulfuromonas sp. DDH964]
MTDPVLLYRDADYVIVHKPAGLLVHRSPIDSRETRFALQLVRDLVGMRVYPVHRLDKPTSGILAFGTSGEAARRLAELFAAGQVEKTYLAVARGVVPDCGVIDHPLVEELDRYGDPLAEPDKGPQQAVTAYRRLASVELPFAVGRYPTSRYSLVEARPKTGRRHQLRRHFKHLLHPLIGDTKYGEGRHNRFFREEFGCNRLLLAAVELAFVHPSTGEALHIVAPLEADFLGIVNRLGWGGALDAGWRG